MKVVGDGFTVQEVLDLAAMRAARVVAGERGLRNPVEAVGVLDVTDPASIQANQLVFSSAYPLLGADLERLVRILAEGRSSALGLKLSGYWDEVPSELLSAADSLELPILILPEGPFDELVNPLLAAIAGRQAESLRRSAELHATLTRAALSEQGELGAVASHLGAAVLRPCAVFDDRGEIVAATSPEHLWTRESLAERVLAFEEPGVLEAGKDRYLVTPIPGATLSVGAVCVQGVDPDDTFARAAIAHAAVVAGMLLMGRRQIQAIHRRFERELMEDIVEGRIRRPQEARWRGAAIGWPVRRQYLVAVVGPPMGRPDSVRADTPPRRGPFDLDEPSLAMLRRHLGSLEREVRLFVRRPGLGIVVHLRADDDARNVAARLADALSVRAGALGNGGLRMGVSEPRRDITELAEAFREAALAVVAPGSAVAQERMQVRHFMDLGAFRLFAPAREPRHLERVAWSLVRPLDDPELPRREEMIETLRSLLAHNMNLAATSEEMFFHYNTIRHRLRTLHRLLGPLTDPSERLRLTLALSALRFLDADRMVRASGMGEVGQAPDHGTVPRVDQPGE